MSAAPGLRALGVDPGRRRVGLAVSDALGLGARPLETLDARAVGDLAGAIAARAVACEAAVVVVGLPLLPSGDVGSSARRALELADQLRAALSAAGAAARVETWHEGDTTARAAARARASGAAPSAGLDAAAAAVILEEWLAARAAESAHAAALGEHGPRD